MILIVVILFMFCWAPLQIFNFLNVAYPDSALFTRIEHNHIIVIWLICNSLAMSNSCYNVFIYGACSVRFKKEFSKVLGKCFPCCRNDIMLELTEASNTKSQFKFTNKSNDNLARNSANAPTKHSFEFEDSFRSSKSSFLRSKKTLMVKK